MKEPLDRRLHRLLMDECDTLTASELDEVIYRLTWDLDYLRTKRVLLRGQELDEADRVRARAEDLIEGLNRLRRRSEASTSCVPPGSPISTPVLLPDEGETPQKD
jgi:hypothetical protein